MGAKKIEGSEINLDALKARVDRVTIEGLSRTKDDYISDSFNELFKVKTFQQLLEKSIETRLNLEKCGCFKTVVITIDASSGPKSTPQCGYELTFKVKELRRVSGRLNTTIENNKPSVGLLLQFPNLAGRGECLQPEMKYYSRDIQTFNTTFFKPLKNNGQFTASIFNQMSENEAAAYKLKELGGDLALSFVYGDFLRQKLEYEGIIRNVNVLHRNVAFLVREQSGYTLKSSVRNTFSYDTRDSYVFPTEGNLLQAKTEFAGLGGNIGFIKNELLGQASTTLFSDFVVQGSFGAGIMSGTKNKFISLVDHFYLGGPLTLRGFKLNAVGRSADGYALGDTAYWVSALHLYAPLPHRPQPKSFGDMFRVHAFVNAGTLTDMRDTPRQSLAALGEKIRLSFGIGLVYRLGKLARLELNYCKPVQYQSEDKVDHGVQFGFGVHFL